MPSRFPYSRGRIPKSCESGFTMVRSHVDCDRDVNGNQLIPTSKIQSLPPPEMSTIKRLQSELKDLMMSEGDSAISAFPVKDTMMLWKGSITGGKGSVFEGKQYRLSLHFLNDYPYKPPFVQFDYPAPFHPNVNVGCSCYHCYGKIHLDILLEEWSSAYDVRTVLLSIKTLLEDPNLSSPVNHDAASLWSDHEEYRKMVEKLYKPPQYGLEERRRTIDRCAGQVRCLREDKKGGFDDELESKFMAAFYNNIMVRALSALSKA